MLNVEDWIRQLRDPAYLKSLDENYLVELYGIWRGNLATSCIQNEAKDNVQSEVICECLKNELLRRLVGANHDGLKVPRNIDEPMGLSAWAMHHDKDFSRAS